MLLFLFLFTFVSTSTSLSTNIVPVRFDAYDIPIRSVYPDPSLTPGATLQVTLDQLCKPGYTSTVRNVPIAVKKKVFEAYGIPWADHGQYEVDHFISLEIGGSNDIHNLWPEPWNPHEYGARAKDSVENYLHHQVCTDKMTLEEAQTAIKGWYTIYATRHPTK